ECHSRTESPCRSLFVSVVPNRLDGAALKRLHALSDIFFGRRLLLDERITAFIVTGEERRRGFPTKVTVDALLIDVEFARNILGPLVRLVRHGWTRDKEAIMGSVKRSPRRQFEV